MELRKSTKKEILDRLSIKPHLRSEDFEVTIEKVTDNTADTPNAPIIPSAPTVPTWKLTILYHHEDDFWFQSVFELKEPTTVVGNVIARPGHLTEEQTYKFSIYNDLLGIVSDWASRIVIEITALPAMRAHEESSRIIQEIIDRFGELPNEYFTRAEAVAMDEKLSMLEEALREFIEKSSQSETVKQRETEQMKSAIEELREDVFQMKKPGFVRKFATRISGAFDPKRKRQLLGDGAEIMGRFLKGYNSSGDGGDGS